MKIATIRDDFTMVAPDTVEEAGMLQWLHMRFQGKTVTLEFDTTDALGCSYHPMMWIRVEAPKAKAK